MRDLVTRCAIAVTWITACGNEPRSKGTALEVAIAKQVGDHVGLPIEVHCTTQLGRCIARHPELGELPIRLAEVAGGWEWAIEGLVVVTAPLEAYLRGAVADLGAAQDVRCVPRVQHLDPDDRIECSLARGGRAFVTVHAGGSTTIEIDLDAAAGGARAERVTSERELELVKLSSDLEGEGDADDE